MRRHTMQRLRDQAFRHTELVGNGQVAGTRFQALAHYLEIKFMNRDLNFRVNPPHARSDRRRTERRQVLETIQHQMSCDRAVRRLERGQLSKFSEECPAPSHESLTGR